jgi:hypothetical protein
LSFDVDLQEFISSYQESPEYFTDEMIITLYHLIQTGEFLMANTILADIECHIVGRTSGEDTLYLLDLVDDGYEWIDLDRLDQIKVVVNNIKKLLV